MKLLEGKVALITGAARGIGKALAVKFANEGADIAFTDLALNDDMMAGIKATEAEIAALGVKCIGYAGNAADFAQTEEVVAQIKADFGHIDVLVNNAGITKDGLMLRMSEAQWDAVINVNLKSAFNFIHACTPIMMRQKAGSINYGEMTTKGYEIELRVSKVLPNQMRLWGNFNMTHAENVMDKVTEPGLYPAYRKQVGYASGQTRSFIDCGFINSYDEMYGATKYDSNDSQKLLGDYHVMDFNGNGVIDENDSAPYGYTGNSKDPSLR